MKTNQINIKNKKAYYDYEILEKLTAGIVLSGTEIKSIRMGKASLSDSFCYFHAGELWLKGLNISEYFWGTHNNHIPDRDRKLLLNKKELKKLDRQVNEKGVTIVALRVFINDRGYAKINIALAKGKREYDKRQTLKEKDAKREMSRMKKNFV
jgi:SsrA-binding protein